MKVADKDYFLDKDGNLTTDETEAHIVLVRKGQEVTAELGEYEIKGVEQEDADEADAQIMEGKTARGGAENKEASGKAKTRR